MALVRTDVSEELTRVTRRNIPEDAILQIDSHLSLFVIIHTFEECHLLGCYAMCQLLQEPHGITSQKTAIFIVTTVKTSNLTYILLYAVRSEVFTAIKIALFWDVTVHILLEWYQHFRGTCYVHVCSFNLCVNAVFFIFLSINYLTSLLMYSIFHTFTHDLLMNTFSYH
jgi:hypothetical protein